MALTPKQQAFIDAYSGNGTAAARAAGYRGSDNVLAQQARENLRNPQVLEAIKARQEEPRARRIATREDRQAFWTATMLDVGADLGHRLRAAELLGKSEADFTDKLTIEAKVTLEQLLAKAGA